MATNLLTYSRRKWRERGYYVEGTESIVRLPGGSTTRRDYMGFCDLVAIPPDGGAWIYLQVTSRSNMSARIRKIRYETTGKGQWTIPIWELVQRCLAHGDRVIVEGWEKKDGRWTDNEREV